MPDADDPEAVPEAVAEVPVVRKGFESAAIAAFVRSKVNDFALALECCAIDADVLVLAREAPLFHPAIQADEVEVAV